MKLLRQFSFLAVRGARLRVASKRAIRAAFLFVIRRATESARRVRASDGKVRGLSQTIFTPSGSLALLT
jgi:hypothetical protein